MKLKVEWSQLLIDRGKLDPLGLWRVGDRMITELFPPFTTVVQQRPARYFSMYCWIIHEAGRGLPEGVADEKFWGKFFVLEGIFLCAIHLHGKHDYSEFGGRIGSEHAESLSNAVNSEGEIDFSSLMSGGIRNGWETNYKRAMLDFNVAEVDTAVPGKIKLTEAGDVLAKAYELGVTNTLFFNKCRRLTLIPKKVIQELADVACPCLLYHANTEELQKERLEIKRLLIKPIPYKTGQDDSMLWESAHLILNILAELHPFKVPVDIHTWRRLLTIGVLPSHGSYTPPEALAQTFNKWRMYALDSLFTYALESALSGFLQELHSQTQMTNEALNETFSSNLLTRSDEPFIAILELLSECSSKDLLEFEATVIGKIKNTQAKYKVVEAFELFYYCLALFKRFQIEEDLTIAISFFEQRARWDNRELTVFQVLDTFKEKRDTTFNVFRELFLKEFIINRQQGIRHQRNKELAWFSFNAETKTYEWEAAYSPGLYRASRFENFMKFLLSLNMVKEQDGHWSISPYLSDEMKV